MGRGGEEVEREGRREAEGRGGERRGGEGPFSTITNSSSSLCSTRYRDVCRPIGPLHHSDLYIILRKEKQVLQRVSIDVVVVVLKVLLIVHRGLRMCQSVGSRLELQVQGQHFNKDSTSTGQHIHI